MSAIDWSPLWISLHTATATIAIVFFVGVVIAWWVERLQSESLKIFADAVITLPMVLPPTVAGFFLLYFLGNNRFLGQLIYQLTGIKIAFSWLATVLAAAVISLPLMYRSARGALSQVDKGMLEAARSLGMTECASSGAFICLTHFPVLLPAACWPLPAGWVNLALRQ